MTRRLLLPDLRNFREGYEPQRLKSDPTAQKPVGLKIVNDATDPAITEIWLYEEIGMWGITAQDVVDALAAVTTQNVRVRINSPGGDVFEGIAISNALASFNGQVTAVVDALCASIATVIAMGCEHITMSPGSQMMIHPASGLAYGDSVAMQKMADLLTFQTANIAGMYAQRAGGKPTDWLPLMSAETWYTADEAVAAGLADATGVVKQAGQSVTPSAAPSWDDFWDLSVFKFAGRAAAPAPVPVPATMCACGPKGWALPDDGHYQHKDECHLYRPVNLPDPVGVNWEVVSNGTACDICEDVIAGSPYAEDDLPDVPVHPNCDCELQVAYGVNNAATKPTATSPSGRDLADPAVTVEDAMRKAFA